MNADPARSREVRQSCRLLADTLPSVERDAVASAHSLARLGQDLVGAGRPDHAFGALMAAVRSMPPAKYWPANVRSALWELVCLLLDGSVDEQIRTDFAAELGEVLAGLLDRFALWHDKVLCRIGLGVSCFTGGEAAGGLAVAAELRALASRGTSSDVHPGRELSAVALLGSTAIRKALGKATPEVHEATRLLMRETTSRGSWRRRLLTRSLINTAIDIGVPGRNGALNAASEAVGQANQLPAGFRVVLLTDALSALSSVLGDLGRHDEAVRAAVEAIGVTAFGHMSAPYGLPRPVPTRKRS